jgi:GNAT superfamily N-acetyltransferase
MSLPDITIRDAQPGDIDEVYSMMDALIRYQKLDKPPIDINVFKRDTGLFPPNTTKYFHTLVAEDGDGVLAGYALYFFTYKPSRGKIFYIEDIFVKEEFRGKGVGHLLMKECAKRAKTVFCYCMKLQVLEWNPAKAFYEDHGGKFNGVKIGDWLEYEYDNKAMDKILRDKK